VLRKYLDSRAQAWPFRSETAWRRLKAASSSTAWCFSALRAKNEARFQSSNRRRDERAATFLQMRKHNEALFCRHTTSPT
jgi:hypothetical protein